MRCVPKYFHQKEATRIFTFYCQSIGTLNAFALWGIQGKELDRRHKIRGRSGFAFSDVRKIVAEAALSEDFQSG